MNCLTKDTPSGHLVADDTSNNWPAMTAQPNLYVLIRFVLKLWSWVMDVGHNVPHVQSHHHDFLCMVVHLLRCTTHSNKAILDGLHLIILLLIYL